MTDQHGNYSAYAFLVSTAWVSTGQILGRARCNFRADLPYGGWIGFITSGGLYSDIFAYSITGRQDIFARSNSVSQIFSFSIPIVIC